MVPHKCSGFLIPTIMIVAPNFGKELTSITEKERMSGPFFKIFKKGTRKISRRDAKGKINSGRGLRQLSFT